MDRRDLALHFWIYRRHRWETADRGAQWSVSPAKSYNGNGEVICFDSTIIFVSAGQRIKDCIGRCAAVKTILKNRKAGLTQQILEGFTARRRHYGTLEQTLKTSTTDSSFTQTVGEETRLDVNPPPGKLRLALMNRKQAIHPGNRDTMMSVLTDRPAVKLFSQLLYQMSIDE